MNAALCVHVDGVRPFADLMLSVDDARQLARSEYLEKGGSPESLAVIEELSVAYIFDPTPRFWANLTYPGKAAFTDFERIGIQPTRRPGIVEGITPYGGKIVRYYHGASMRRLPYAGARIFSNAVPDFRNVFHGSFRHGGWDQFWMEFNEARVLIAGPCIDPHFYQNILERIPQIHTIVVHSEACLVDDYGFSVDVGWRRVVTGLHL